MAVLKLKASHFGVPQKRVRAFVVCTLGGTAEQARELERRARDVSTRRETTMRDVFPHMQTYFQWGCFKMPHIHSTDKPCITLRTYSAARATKRTFKQTARCAGPLADAHYLTIPELCVIQGLGKDYRFPEGMSRSRMGKQIGSSVVAPAMKWVMGQLCGV